MGSSQTTLQSELENVVGNNRVGLILLSLVLILAGIAAIAFPYVSTISTEFFIGWLLVFTGICQMLHSLQARAKGGFLWVFLIGVLETAVGVALLVFPLAGAFTLTIFLAMTFILEGFFRAALALQIKPMAGWGWVLIGGILSIFIGGLLYAELPSSALWAIGLMVGINVTMSGLALLILAIAAGASKGIEPQTADEVDEVPSPEAETKKDSEQGETSEQDGESGQDEKKDADSVAEADKDIAVETETDKASELNGEENKAANVEASEEKTPEIKTEKSKEATGEVVVKTDGETDGKTDEEAGPKTEGNVETEKPSNPNKDGDTKKDVDEVPVKTENIDTDTDIDTDTGTGTDVKTEAAPETKEETGDVKNEEKAPEKDPQTKA
ncbi:MAG: hypothetical protein COA69_05755 [Robiginitomaculum sp.]|nr:MAG: hypothetical protein COA69_05755 [Robiginitomaculum sp.]